MALITAKSLEEFKEIQMNKWKELVPSINTNPDSMVSIDATVIAEIAYLLQQDLITQTNNAFLAYATGDELTNLGNDRGVERKEASKSFGEVTFSRSEKAPANYSILAGTTISTEEDSIGNVLTFKTIEDGTLFGVLEKPTGLSNTLGTSGSIGNGTYSYSVTAVSGDGTETDASTQISAVISNGNTNNSIQLSWGAVTRASYYGIYLGGVLLGTSNINAYTDTVGTTSSIVTPPATNETGALEITIPVESVGAGSIYNVGIGSIVKLIEKPIGIEEVVNIEQMSGGADTETDDIYRKRIKEALLSNTGKTTAKGYEATALSVSGVSTATAIHEPGNPVNSISVFITSSDINNPIPTQELLDLVTLELNKDENRAVCDTLIAKAAIVHPVNVTVNITEFEETNYTQEEVTASITEGLTALMKTIPTEGTLRVVAISNTIHDSIGVIDYTLVTPTSNYTTGTNETVSLGVLTVNYI